MQRTTACLVLAAIHVVAAPGPAQAGVVSEPILRLHLEGRWDENLVDDGGDFSSLVRPGVGWRLEAPTALAEIEYLPDGLFYGGGGVGRGGINHRLIGVQDLSVSTRTHLRLEQLFERAFDPTGLSRPGVVRSVGTSSYLRLQGDLSHRLTRRLTLGLRAREEVVRIEDAASSDGAVHSPEGWASYALGPRDTLSFGYRYQHFDSLHGLDAASHEPLVGWGHSLARHLRLELEAGPAFYQEEGRDGIVPVGRASLVHRRPRITLGLHYERSLFGATGFDGAVWGDGASGVFTWLPARRWEATFVLGVFQNGAAPREAAFVRGLGAAAVVSFSLGADTALQLTWRRILQEQIGTGDLPALDISRNIMAIGFSWELGRDRRER